MAAPAGTEGYSRFTQLSVGAWRRLLEPRHIGPASVPWAVIWFGATGALLALETVQPPLGSWLAGIILLGFALNVVLPKRG